MVQCHFKFNDVPFSPWRDVSPADVWIRVASSPRTSDARLQSRQSVRIRSESLGQILKAKVNFVAARGGAEADWLTSASTGASKASARRDTDKGRGGRDRLHNYFLGSTVEGPFPVPEVTLGGSETFRAIGAWKVFEGKFEGHVKCWHSVYQTTAVWNPYLTVYWEASSKYDKTAYASTHYRVVRMNLTLEIDVFLCYFIDLLLFSIGHQSI